MKIVINKCYGGFEVSCDVIKELGFHDKEKFCKYYKGIPLENSDFGIESDDIYAYRTDERLIKAIEKVGLKKASGSFAELKIVEIPDDVEYYIDDYDGIESIHEVHRIWQ